MISRGWGIIMKRIFSCCLLLLPLLFACVGPLDTGPSLGESCHRFSEAMRWHDFIGAAMFVQQAVQPEFTARFPQDDDDLRIVGSRVDSIEVSEDQQSAEATYVLEYYRLPSSRVKKWHWSQHWRQYRKNISKPGLWLIENAPPPLP